MMIQFRLHSVKGIMVGGCGKLKDRLSSLDIIDTICIENHSLDLLYEKSKDSISRWRMREEQKQLDRVQHLWDTSSLVPKKSRSVSLVV